MTSASWRGFRRRLQAWYDEHGRRLPWRLSRDPYHIWISEIMLQQTTVVAVVPYFERFLARFPDVSSLANAPLDDVLRLWEGLGYYSRARNLHRAAQQVMLEHGGTFPADVERLQALPGVGRYTAGAVASFAFNLPAPIVEANTLRLYCRLLGFAGDPRSAQGQKLLWRFGAEAVTGVKSTGEDGPGRVNQALMELGAKLCTPQSPGCEICPVKTYCRAFQDGTVVEIPALAARPAMTPVTDVTVAVRRDDKVLIRRRQPGERWAGLWDFPRFTWHEGENSGKVATGWNRGRDLEADPTVLVPPNDWLADQLWEVFGLQIDSPRFEKIGEIKHSVTRYRIRLLCYVVETASLPMLSSLPSMSPTSVSEVVSAETGEERCWVSPDELVNFPLSMTGRKFAKQLTSRPPRLFENE